MQKKIFPDCLWVDKYKIHIFIYAGKTAIYFSFMCSSDPDRTSTETEGGGGASQEQAARL